MLLEQALIRKSQNNRNQTMKIKIITISLILLLPITLFAQGRPYEGPEDPAADISDLREGFMNGNRAILYYLNNGQIADIFKFGYNNPQDSKWPNNNLGTRLLDVGTVVVFSKVFVKNDSIPVTDLNEVASLKSTGDVDSMIFVQSGWGWNVDINYEKTIKWQYYPVKGYLNPTQDYIAMSNKPDSWPIEGWPSRGFLRKWQGEWNGRFGRGIQYADLESYFVFNDAQDLEKLVKRNDPEQGLITDSLRYYPRPGKYIGDLNPGVTVQKGYPWGGLGIRISARGFQWNNPEARDMIFWEFDISNISDYDLPVSGFGYDLNMAVGDEHLPDDDIGYFNAELDMVYVWDYDGVGVGGVIPGVFALAYLESPGLAYDNIDNDDDGLIDEKRDNPAGEKIGPYDGITDVSKFLDFYQLKNSDLHEHFEGDEDQDWLDGNDVNGNGVYAVKQEDGTWIMEPGEIAGSDVGLDGVGPLDLNYFVPDQGECNHIPDFLEGQGCEPNFAVTDISESDMVGLTSFRLKTDMQRNTYNWYHVDDETCFDFLNAHVLDEFTGDTPQSLTFVATSSTFPLYKGRTERISVALLHAYENLHEISAAGHEARNLFKLKANAQVIYENDYRFTQPPVMPTITATSGDGKVILTWDDRADKLTREPMLNHINDFEGYKLYRSTDKYFQDAEIITDNHGARMAKQPIYQCDLIDEIKGNADFGEIGGVEFYLGDDTGISHHFVDSQVQNGRTYYYAIVAYDYGAPEITTGLSPTENNIIIELDEAEKIIRMGKNVAVVIPGQQAAGYKPASTTSIENNNVIGAGSVVPEIYDIKKVKENHTYKIVFDVDTVGHRKYNIKFRHPMDYLYINNGYKVFDATEENRLVLSESPGYYRNMNIVERLVTGVGTEEFKKCIDPAKEISSDIFDGIQLKIKLHGLSAEWDSLNSGWLTGNSPINVAVSELAESYFPWRYEIVFTGDSAFTTQTTVSSTIKDFNYKRIPKDDILFEYDFPFYVVNKNMIDSTGAYEKLDMVLHDRNMNGMFDADSDYIYIGHMKDRSTASKTKIDWTGSVIRIDFHNVPSENEMPNPGDIYRVDFYRPYVETDTLKFTVNPDTDADSKSLDEEMEKIRIVPNPYVMTNAMEPAVSNKFLNQRRRVMFTHIPAKCVIRIFTSSGVLVDKMDVINEPNEGIVHWNLLSREDLEVAAGMYIYHIKSNVTGKEKVGKFAIIK